MDFNLVQNKNQNQNNDRNSNQTFQNYQFNNNCTDFTEDMDFSNEEYLPQVSLITSLYEVDSTTAALEGWLSKSSAGISGLDLVNDGQPKHNVQEVAEVINVEEEPVQNRPAKRTSKWNNPDKLKVLKQEIVVAPSNFDSFNETGEYSQSQSDFLGQQNQTFSDYFVPAHFVDHNHRPVPSYLYEEDRYFTPTKVIDYNHKPSGMFPVEEIPQQELIVPQKLNYQQHSQHPQHLNSGVLNKKQRKKKRFDYLQVR
jgi:hypothetical protein